MYFSNMFLEKGGNLVCKVLNCESCKILDVKTLLLRKAAKFSFTKATTSNPL
jgi:hypothetical protein